jgi:hypothetical protein
LPAFQSRDARLGKRAFERIGEQVAAWPLPQPLRVRVAKTAASGHPWVFRVSTRIIQINSPISLVRGPGIAYNNKAIDKDQRADAI